MNFSTFCCDLVKSQHVLVLQFFINYLCCDSNNKLFIAGDTPLHLAAKNGCTDALKLLVDAKADVDVQDSKSGKTALHHAVENDDLPMVGYLVTEVSIKDVYVCTHFFFFFLILAFVLVSMYSDAICMCIYNEKLFYKHLILSSESFKVTG